MGDLQRYRARRDPVGTPEPFGEERSRRSLPASAPRAFVVQQHAARRMHWDLRLEIGEVLASWAVPRGPSLDPGERRLAVRTEDHPLEYADFEGVIPAGNYGAGAMIVWDRGIYHSADGRAPAEGLEAGKLDLLLEGHKLRGRFALVRTHRESGRDWLLLYKGAPPEETGELVERWPASVLSGLDVAELRDGVSRDEVVAARAREAGAPRREVDAARLRPMLATAERRPFSREGWIFELKYDGVRVICERRGEAVRIFARRGGERTALYPELALALRHLPLEGFVLDGEIVANDASGRSSFERLARRFTQTDPAAIAHARAEIPVQLQAFDLLAAAGHDLRALPLVERKRILSLFVPRRGFVRFADHVEGDGLALFEAARDHGLEGVVAKRASSSYEAGRRSRSWLKLKAPRRAALAVVGLLPGRGSRARLGSLMLAWQVDGDLVYAGNVGSGLDEASIERLLGEIASDHVDDPPCRGLPDPPPRGCTYLRPRLVCDVRFTETTSAGLLRQPVCEKLRPDLSPEDCRPPDARPREPEPAAADAPPPPAALELTRVDKVFWPVEGYTKGDLLAYYEAIWPWLAPYLRDRPVVLTRYPDGIEGKSFYQKNAPDFTPSWARRERIDDTDYFVCNDLRTLLYVINSGAIPLHVWSARIGSLESPDWLVIDLDPKQAPFTHVVALARHLHALLKAFGAPHFVKTSGQDGLHVLLPLGARLGHDDARRLAEVLARVLCAERPDIATVARPLAARAERVYVDFLQNGRGKLIAAPFSVRPRPGAPVSTPLGWRQVSARLDPARWNLRTTPRRMARSGDPMRPLLEQAVEVDSLLAGLAERLERAMD
jgi:bifunctional non-homologous end joining protein LigD